MRVGIASDEDLAVVDSIVAHLVHLGHDVVRLARGAAWPEVGRVVGEQVASGVLGCGVVCCWTGTGVALAANKVRGVRAALCVDVETAVGARRWNDANVLALSLRLTDAVYAAEIVSAFLSSECDRNELETIGRVEPAAQSS